MDHGSVLGFGADGKQALGWLKGGKSCNFCIVDRLYVIVLL